MEPEGSSPHSQAPATCPYPEPAQSSSHTYIPLPEDPSYYYPPIYTWVSPTVSFLQVSPPKLCTHLSPPPYALHAPSISFFSILSPARDWVRSTDHSATHYVIFSIPRYLVPLRPKYSPQYPILKHLQPTFLPQCQGPSFTPIQNDGQNYSSIYFNL
jgi:hypothetical protein